MRNAIRELLALGRFPSEDEASVEQVEQYQTLIERIAPPVELEEAVGLLAILPLTNDTLYGLSWTVLHLIESAPGWPATERLAETTGYWADVLRGRAKKAVP